MISDRSKKQNGFVCGFQSNAFDNFLLLFVIIKKKFFESNVKKSSVIFRHPIGDV